MVSRVGGGVSEDLLADIEEYLTGVYRLEDVGKGVLLLHDAAEEITRLRDEVTAYECAYQRT